jgi:regulator of cell morphogenesis and NO signaling
MPITKEIEPSLTINAIVARHPETIRVFNRFGLDTCCGGGVRVDEAAQRDAVDLETLRAALNQAIAGE